MPRPAQASGSSMIIGIKLRVGTIVFRVAQCWPRPTYVAYSRVARSPAQANGGSNGDMVANYKQAHPLSEFLRKIVRFCRVNIVMRLEVVLVVVVDDEEARRDLTRDVCVFLLKLSSEAWDFFKFSPSNTYNRSEVLNYRHYLNRHSVI